MIVKKIEKNNSDGTVAIQWVLDTQQQLFLINFALEFLVAKGLIHVTNITEEELKKMEEEMEKDIASSFLAGLDKENMGNA